MEVDEFGLEYSAFGSFGSPYLFADSTYSVSAGNSQDFTIDIYCTVHDTVSYCSIVYNH